MIHRAVLALCFTATVLWTGVAAAGTSVREAAFSIEGMACGQCAARLDKVLEKKDGITEVDVDFDHATAYVRFDPRRLSVADVEAAVDATGFEGTLKPFHARFRGSPNARESTPVSLELVLGVGQRDGYVHPDAPLDVTLEADDGVELAQSKLARSDARGDAEQGKDRVLTFAVAAIARTAGTRTVRANVRFFFCTPGSCTRKNISTSIGLRVADGG